MAPGGNMTGNVALSGTASTAGPADSTTSQPLVGQTAGATGGGGDDRPGEAGGEGLTTAT